MCLFLELQVMILAVVVAFSMKINLFHSFLLSRPAQCCLVKWATTSEGTANFNLFGKQVLSTFMLMGFFFFLYFFYFTFSFLAHPTKFDVLAIHEKIANFFPISSLFFIVILSCLSNVVSYTILKFAFLKLLED